MKVTKELTKTGKAISTNIRLAKTGRRTIDTLSLENVIFAYQKCIEIGFKDNEQKTAFYAGVASVTNLLDDVIMQSNDRHEYRYTFNRESLVDIISLGFLKAYTMMERRKTDLEKAIEEVEFYQKRPLE